MKGWNDRHSKYACGGIIGVKNGREMTGMRGAVGGREREEKIPTGSDWNDEKN